MRKIYLQELENLKEDIILYSIHIENLIIKTETLLNDESIDKNYFKIQSNEIHSMWKKIERQAITILSTQQPVARDLRFISSSIKISNYIRRIGEHALDALELLSTVKFSQFEKYKLEPTFVSLKAEVLKMFKDAISLFVKFDSRFRNDAIDNKNEVAYNIIKNDDVVDDIYEKHIDFIIKILKETDGMEKDIIHLIQISKYFERIGDDIEEIVINILFVINGEDYEELDLHS